MGRDWLPPTLQNLLTQTGILLSAFLRRFEPPPVGSRPTPCPRERIKKRPKWGIFYSWRCGKILRRTPYNKIQGLSGNFAHFGAPVFTRRAQFPGLSQNFPQKQQGIFILGTGISPQHIREQFQPAPARVSTPFIANYLKTI